MNVLFILSIAEGIIGFAMFLLFGIIFIGGFQIIAQKYFGAKIHGKFGAISAHKENQQEKETFELLSKIDPIKMQEAIKRCKKKRYAMTHQNILSEFDKL